MEISYIVIPALVVAVMLIGNLFWYAHKTKRLSEKYILFRNYFASTNCFSLISFRMLINA